jgi:Putative zinc-finger
MLDITDCFNPFSLAKLPGLGMLRVGKSKFSDGRYFGPSGLGTSTKIMNAHLDSSGSDMDPLHTTTTTNHTHDRFELLSAYLDGEVTAEERRQVELWLAEDPQVQNMHRRLMMLRQGLKSMPAPTPAQPVKQTIDQVFEKVDRRSRFRLIMGGATAAAAALVATVIGVSQFNNGPNLQVATKSPTTTIGNPAEDATTGELLISLDEPVFLVSKTATVDPLPNQSPSRVGTKDAVNNGQ